MFEFKKAFSLRCTTYSMPYRMLSAVQCIPSNGDYLLFTVYYLPLAACRGRLSDTVFSSAFVLSPENSQNMPPPKPFDLM